jgi:hypothetical protein
MNKLPLNDAIAHAIARLVDDSMSDRREPSHSSIEFEIGRVNLTKYDPNKPGVAPVGKMKRVRTVLVAALEQDKDNAEKFAYNLVALITANGGFRDGSPNYVGNDVINNLKPLLRANGILLGDDGSISPLVLDGLSTKEMSDALRTYITRAKKGDEDSALIVGTGKDLLEATAAHVLVTKTGTYPTTVNFPTLLGQAFICLDMATSLTPKSPNEHPRKDIERNLFDLACSINRLRNKQGTGHGRPWLPDLKSSEAKEAVQMIGIIAEKMLLAL